MRRRLRTTPHVPARACRAMAANVENGRIWGILGAARFYAGDMKGASQDLQRNFELTNGGSPMTLFQLAAARQQLGDAGGAGYCSDLGVQRHLRTAPCDPAARGFRDQAARALQIEN